MLSHVRKPTSTPTYTVFSISSKVADSYLYNIKCTGLPLFSVYGPWGQPDMAYYSFTKAILEHRPIDVYNYGRIYRDFTYIDGVTEIMTRLLADLDKGQRNEQPYDGNTAETGKQMQISGFTTWAAALPLN